MEIGSIFEISVEDLFVDENQTFKLPFMDERKYNTVRLFNSGRSAIEYTFRHMKSKEVGKVLLPSFTCTSIVDAVKRAGWQIDYYRITKELRIDIGSVKDLLGKGFVDAIYVIQYFGGYQEPDTYAFLKELQFDGVVLVEDISHALYTKHPQYIGFGDFVLGSIRKWLPIPDGAFLATDCMLPSVPIESGCSDYSFLYFVAQIMKSAYLQDKRLKKERFLDVGQAATSSLFSDYTIREISPISRRYLTSYNMHEVVERRIKNYDYLVDNTKHLLHIKPVFARLPGQVPIGFTILSNERDSLLEFLVRNDVYCNVHWRISDACISADPVAAQISESILTIPCDQRYSEKEMDYVIQVLERFWGT